MKLNLFATIDASTENDLTKEEEQIIQEFFNTPICDDEYDDVYKNMSDLIQKYLPELIKNCYVYWTDIIKYKDGYMIK